jgi:peroxiredoxin
VAARSELTYNPRTVREVAMSWRVLSAVSVLALAGLAAPAEEPPQIEPTPPAEFGKPFPAGPATNLNLDAGPNSIDLRMTLGKKPIVLFYWIPGNPRADELFRDVQELVREVGTDKVALFGVSFQQPGRGPEVARDRARELAIKVPVLDDTGFVIGQRLRVQSVPNITLIDSDGSLRLTNGASLYQTLEYQMNVETAIRRLARTGHLGTYGYLARYHPVNELIGKKCPDFQAPLLGQAGAEDRSWHGLLDAKKVNVLIFWSVDCPHCRQSLPEFNAWLKDNGEGFNVYSAAKVSSEATEVKTREFCEMSGFVFPTIEDRDQRISKLYQVTSTPTFLIIGPDGVIDSVLLSSDTDFGRALERKKRELLKQG